MPHLTSPWKWMRKARLQVLVIYAISMYLLIALILSPYDVCFTAGSSSYCYIPLSLSPSIRLFLFIFIFVSIALTRSIYHGISGFLAVTPLRPWPIWVPEQEQPIAHEGPFTAPITPVHARNEMQPVHIAVPRRPDPDHWGVHSDKSSGDRICDWHDGHGSKEYPQGIHGKE